MATAMAAVETSHCRHRPERVKKKGECNAMQYNAMLYSFCLADTTTGRNNCCDM